MSVETTAAPGQAPVSGTPQPGQAPTVTQDQQPTGAEQTGQDPAASQPTEFDPSTVQDPAVKAYLDRQAAELRRARDDAAKYRTERQTLAEQVQQHQRQSETDQQRQEREATEARERLERLEQENRDLRVGRAVQDAARDAHNPSTLWELMQARGIDVETDDKGQPQNVAAVVAALRESDPYLFKAPRVSTDGGAGGGQTRATQSAGEQINDMLRGRTTSAAR